LSNSCELPASLNENDFGSRSSSSVFPDWSCWVIIDCCCFSFLCFLRVRSMGCRVGDSTKISGVSLYSLMLGSVLFYFLSFLYVSGGSFIRECVAVVCGFDCSLVVTLALAVERSLCRG
jgi:hypothetical protein